MKQRALAALVAVAVAGCTVGPDYVRPTVDTPAAWRIDYPKAADVANTKWWEQFGDPVLNDLIETALRDNRDVRIAAARVDQFIGALDRHRSQLYPQIGYGADASRARASRGGRAADSARRRSRTSRCTRRRWARPGRLDLFGRVRRLTEAAQAQVYASEQAQRGVVLTLVSSVATSYIVLRALDRQLEIAQATATQLRRDRAHLRPALQGRHRVADRGVADPLADQQALAAIPAVRAGHRGAGEPDLDPARPQPGADPARQDHRPARRAADSRRPAVHAAAAPARHPAGRAEPGGGQRQHRRGARALLSDHLAHRRARHRQHGRSATFSPARRRAWLLGAGLTGPIFTFGAIEGQVRSAEAQRAAGAGCLPADDPERVPRDQRRARPARRRRSRKSRCSASAWWRCASSRGCRRLKFDKGVSGYLEVLVAENELFAAELASVQPAGRAATRRSSTSTRRWAAAGWTSRLAWRPSRKAWAAAAPIPAMTCQR